MSLAASDPAGPPVSIEREQWRIYLRNLPLALAGNAGCAALFGAAVWWETEQAAPLVWVAAVCALCLARWAAGHWLGRRTDVRGARAVFMIGNALGGGIWGLAFAAFLPLTGFAIERRHCRSPCPLKQ